MMRAHINFNIHYLQLLKPLPVLDFIMLSKYNLLSEGLLF